MAGDLINGEIPEHWEFTTLGEICQRGGGNIQTGPFGSQLHASDYVPVGVPSIMPTNIGENRIVEDGIVRITEEDANRLGQHRLRAGDIIYSRRGDVEKRALIREREEGWFCGTGCLKVRLGSGVVDPLFASLFLGHPAIREWIVRHAVGATMPNLNTSIMSAVPFALPPLSEQKAIAAVLGALDDKIELNWRMNATLEAMARALFQSWFVDFDPVRAKLDGRKPVGLDETTAALFPANFHDSETGHIPKGWTVGKVSDLATLNRGAVNPGDFPTETFDHFSLPAFDNGRTPKMELGSAIMSNKLTVTPNAVLLSKLNPHIPRIWLPDLHVSSRSVCSTEFMVACSKPGVSREYLFSLFTSSCFASIYGTLVTGTTGSHQRIRPESVLDMKIFIPPAPLIRAFTGIAKPMFDRINRNTDQSRTLATLRDTLLPKLLSGELSVAETLTA
ncbi:MAG: restriction endonuclease subunit S [Verrucomicrobiae bacterium]